MKKALIITLGLCFMASLATVSQAADEAKKTDKAARQAELIKKYDKNGDGKLDEQEMAAMKEDVKKNKAAKKDAPKKDAPKPEEKK